MLFSHLHSLDLMILLCNWLPFSMAQRPTSYQARNFNTISSIYNFTIYPNQLPIIAQATSSSIPELAHLFSPKASGRIQEVGNFTNFRHSIEYFFGLAPTPQAPTYGAFTAAELVQFSSDCPSVASSTVYFTVTVADNSRSDYGRVVTYLKQTGFWHFDEEGRVDYYDLYIPGLQDFAAVLNGADFNQILVQLLATKRICQGAQQVCTGAHTQYKPQIGISIAGVLNTLGLNTLLDAPLINQLGLGSLNLGELSCFSQLIKKGFGTFDKLWADTVTCRIVHLMLAAVDPEDHCPHVGPTGGGKCVDYPYEKRLYDDVPLFEERLRFRCPQYGGM